MSVNIGVDLGGTKILVEALSRDGQTLAKEQTKTPRHDYHATLKAIVQLIFKIERQLQIKAPVGIGMPGSLMPKSKLVQNANSTWLNGKNIKADMNQLLDRDVRFANDANCFALSEASDGAGAGAKSLFGVIMGTGVGGGLIVDGKIINGPYAIGGEWGHCSLPFPSAQEVETAIPCWCGQKGCIESWISGPALTKQFNLFTNQQTEKVQEIIALAKKGNSQAQTVLDQHTNRTARALAMVVNIFDPEIIILGGGLSQLEHLYEQLPPLMSNFIFSKEPKKVDIHRPKHGATSGVRGAARLWPF